MFTGWLACQQPAHTCTVQLRSTEYIRITTTIQTIKHANSALWAGHGDKFPRFRLGIRYGRALQPAPSMESSGVHALRPPGAPEKPGGGAGSSGAGMRGGVRISRQKKKKEVVAPVQCCSRQPSTSKVRVTRGGKQSHCQPAGPKIRCPKGSVHGPWNILDGDRKPRSAPQSVPSLAWISPRTTFKIQSVPPLKGFPFTPPS